MHKEWKFILTALLASISVLPGCGKSSSGNGSNTGVYGVVGAGATSGSNVALTSNYNGGMSFSISGNVQVTQAGNLYGEAYAQGLAGGPVGMQYYRADGPGDVINFSTTVSGNAAALSGVVTLSAQTLQAIQYVYGPNVSIAGVGFIYSTPNNSGMVNSPLTLILSNGAQCHSDPYNTLCM